MKVHAFKVERSETSEAPEGVLEAIRLQTGLRERIRMINGIELRVEAIERRTDDVLNGPAVDIWLLDLIRIRTDHGPARVGRDSEVEGFEFEEEEGFGEEAAALFVPATGYMLVQYNHFGVRAGVLADYLSAFRGGTNNLYTFKPKYDVDVERRLTQQGITRRVAFTLDISHLSEQDRQRGQALSEAIDYGREVGADRIRVEISVQGERNRSLREKALEGITALRSILGQNPDAVTKLEVAGKADRDSVTEVLDLVGHRLSIEFTDLKVGADLRFPREERWQALMRARRGWEHLLTP